MQARPEPIMGFEVLEWLAAGWLRRLGRQSSPASQLTAASGLPVCPDSADTVCRIRWLWSVAGSEHANESVTGSDYPAVKLAVLQSGGIRSFSPRLRFGAFQIEGQECCKRIVLQDVGRPSVRLRDRGIQGFVGMGQPRGPCVVELGQCPLLQSSNCVGVTQNRSFGVAKCRFFDPPHPFGQVQPTVPECDQVPGGIRDGNRSWVRGVVDCWDVGFQTRREWECLKGGSCSVAGIVVLLYPRCHVQRPGFVEATVKNTENCVVIARDDNQLIVWTSTCVQSGEHPVRGSLWSNNETWKLPNGTPHCRMGSAIDPPVLSATFVSIVDLDRPDALCNIGKWCFV